MMALAATFGISQFVFIQWVAPFLSEFPEKTSAFAWARRVTRAPHQTKTNGIAHRVPFRNRWPIGARRQPILKVTVMVTAVTVLLTHLGQDHESPLQ